MRSGSWAGTPTLKTHQYGQWRPARRRLLVPPERNASARDLPLPGAAQIARSCGPVILTRSSRPTHQRPPESSLWPKNQPRPRGPNLLGHMGTWPAHPRGPAAVKIQDGHSTGQETTNTASPVSNHRLRADGRAARSTNAHSLHLRYSVPDSFHCSRASVLPRPGLARDPTGVALAAPIPHGPRAGR